jgi:RND family efflux transporter MFP subunit
LAAEQQFQAAEAALAISRSQLLILGYSQGEIEEMDPIAEAERVAYYPLRSPLSGTIIARNAPLSKHVDDELELFQIADLSTIWLRADVFEKDLSAVRSLRGCLVAFETGSYPGRRFQARVFSLGDVIDEETRATRLLAVVDNSERLLKPGMFADIELNPQNDADVLQVPTSAIQRHSGATFVFVPGGAGTFRRRDVTLGRLTADVAEVRSGLEEGDSVVVRGGFALKSELLSELLAEE